MKLIMMLMLVVNLTASEIIIDVKKCLMTFKDSSKEQTFVVGTVKQGLPIPEDGYITKVDLSPSWYPTQRTKDYFKKHKGIVLPSEVKYLDPLNYMGSFKITLTNKSERGQIYRIHGNVDKSSLGKRSTGGCVRMDNQEGKEFAKMIQERLVQGEKIKVIYI